MHYQSDGGDGFDAHGNGDGSSEIHDDRLILVWCWWYNVDDEDDVDDNDSGTDEGNVDYISIMKAMAMIRLMIESEWR